MSVNTQLIEAIKNDKLIVFVGSGLSRSLGLPTWRDLIKEFLIALSEDNNSEKYKWLLQGLTLNSTDLPIAEIDLLEFIKEEQRTVYKVLASAIDKEFKDDDLIIHTMLGEITKKIITTNYDTALERAVGIRTITPDNDFYLANTPDSYIFKLHGSIDVPSSCVLFKQDYEKLYKEHSAAIQKLRHLITDHTILFVGFSLNDPYVRYQFEFINSVYKNLGSKHYILNTESYDFSKYGVESITLSDWKQSFHNLLTSLIEVKTSLVQLTSDKEDKIENVKKIRNDFVKVAILISSPVDRSTSYSFDQITRHFSKFEMEIDCNYISESTLQDLENYDYVFIYTMIVQDKLLIEDRYLKSKFITINELEHNIAMTDVKGIFIFSEIIIDIKNYDLTLPIAVVADTDVSTILFRLFKKASIEQLNESIIYNKEKFVLRTLTKGRPVINIYHEKNSEKLSEFIEGKKLVNFVGREIDLEDIARKIIEANNRIITVKGSGGIGKTTTVKVTAIELFKRGYFNDGVYFIDCEFITDYKTFEYKVAQCFGLESSIELKSYLIKNQLKQDKLIILDNFEPLLYLHDKDIIKDLVSFISDFATIVITSREWLGFDFESKHELRSLTTEEAYQLFCKYYSGSVDKTDNKILKDDIVDKLLNNNPLAIKIVAKNLPKFKNMSLLRDELEADFFNIIEQSYEDIFEEDKDQNIERSKSLFQSIFYSHSKLTHRERLLFEILSLFPDGIHMRNVRAFFERIEYKTSLNKITDKEINSLENKSLIDINGGFIKLQSILGRFAEYQFKKRKEEEKVGYYEIAYEYVEHFLSILRKMYDLNGSDALKLFDRNFNNFIKSLDYIDKYEDNKKSKLKYLLLVADFCGNIEQPNKFYEKYKELQEFFKDVENANLAIDSNVAQLEYYEGKFGKAYTEISRMIPIEQINNIDVDDEIGQLALSSAFSIYQFKHGKEILMYYIQNKRNYTVDLFKYILFTIGQYDSFNLLNNKNNNINYFFKYDLQFNLGIISKEELVEYISNLYKKEYIEIMQSSYILAKMGEIDKETIDKLVVTNPYTMGLRNLMLAFIEKEDNRAMELFEIAIKKLEHIQYHYVEAIYYYIKYLRNKGDVDYSNYWFTEGIKVAEENHYMYMVHKFMCLKNEEDELYKELDSQSELKKDIDEHIERWNKTSITNS